jgi:hypothetical protein
MKSIFRNSLASKRQKTQGFVALFAIAPSVFAGTISPQLSSMDPNRPYQVIVQHTASLTGVLVSAVCGVANLLELLPGGELCATTAGVAMNLANNPSVAHVSVNILQGTGSALPVYDYIPRKPFSQPRHLIPRIRTPAAKTEKESYAKTVCPRRACNSFQSLEEGQR